MSRYLRLAVAWSLAAGGVGAFGVRMGLQAVLEPSSTITAPPDPRATESCAARGNVFKRSANSTNAPSCQFGGCGTSCLAQGAFCCNPGGTLATAPLWVCDNGACVTSVRGDSGGIDCYDPDNPGGTIQSCLDNIPTTTCQATDKCYQCSTDVPFCHWQTYVAAGEPTLRWFSCISTSAADETLYASTITNNLLGASPSGSRSNGTSSSSSSLSTGAIAGIAVAGAVAVIACVAIVAIACVRVRRKGNKPPAGTGTDPNSPQPQHGQAAVSPLSPGDAKLAQQPMAQQQQYYEMAAQEPQELPGGGVGKGPEGTAKLAKYAGQDGVVMPVAEMPGWEQGQTQWDAQHQQQQWDGHHQQWDAQQQHHNQEWSAQDEHLTPPPGQPFVPSPHFTPPPGQQYMPSPHFTPPPQHERYTPPQPPGQQGYSTPPPQQGYGYGQADPQHSRQYSG